LEAFGHFFIRTSAENQSSIKLQTGFFRSNCLDSLDRTNVVQSLICNEAMQEILNGMQILRDGQSLNLQQGFQVR